MPDSGPGLHVIKLYDQKLLVKPQAGGNAAGDFYAGIKIGESDYDQRLHAFFLVFNDWSGGIGYDLLRERSEIGIYEKSEGANTRRAGHFTLPPLVTSLTSYSGQTATTAADNAHPRTGVLASAITNGVCILCGRYAVHTADGTTFTLAGITGLTSAASETLALDAVGDLDNWTLGAGATKVAAVAADDGDTTYISDTGTTNRQRFTVAAPASIVTGSIIRDVKVTATLRNDVDSGDTTLEVKLRIGSGTESAGQNITTTGDNSIYQTRTTAAFATTPGGAAWTKADLDDLQVTIKGDNLLGTAYFRITALYVTVRYTLPYELTGLAEVNISGWKVALWSLASTEIWSTTTGTSYSYLGSAAPANIADIIWHASLAWIITYDGSDGGKIYTTADFVTYTARATIKGQPSDGRWVGPYLDAAGAISLYFCAGGKLQYIDTATYALTEIALGKGVKAVRGALYNGACVITDGQSSLRYQVSGNGTETVSEIGWPQFRKLPSELVGARIRNLEGAPEVLYGIVDRGSSGGTAILDYTGIGWEVDSLQVNSTEEVHTAGIGFVPVIGDSTKRALYVVTHNSARTSFRISAMHLPIIGEHPVVGTDDFQDGPLKTYGPRVDGGFSELTGAAYKVIVDGTLSSTSKVNLYYKIDDGAETLLGTFTAAGQELWFESTPGAHDGKKFRTVQLIPQLDRGGTATDSPDLYALILVYSKRPDWRGIWQFIVDVNAMVADKVMVDGQPATYKRVWDKLKALWNRKTLMPLTIGDSIENTNALENNLRVQIAELRPTVEKIREGSEDGEIALTLLEPII